jgi:hypothetical protein
MGIQGVNGVDEHQGFMIVMPFEKRFILRFPAMDIRARILSDNRVIISGIPMESYSLLYHSVEAIQRNQQNGTWGDFDFMLDGFSNGCNSYLANHEAGLSGLANSLREYHVIFPSTVVLDVACFKKGNPHEDREFNVKLPFKILSTTNEYNITPPSWASPPGASAQPTHKDLTGNTHWIVFYVARLDTATFKKNRTTFNPNPKSSDLAQEFGI